ncbi:hypothetical protein PPTG_14019 [Phytophthora nicotianae INRA-310]|uniref:Uncharacterized protein n=1 Tax=Phytophthora nicotianae (strain INRA-310) TaxID=761204 RepID=W2PZ84_PHYN3|nr:hypothetical protein PPTG_14019 [Phytophthora nicotianae INRA-310]ETN06258.1 hypothetical protein PPTG_14019 [Phytophthora nicotianae INRA-310]
MRRAVSGGMITQNEEAAASRASKTASLELARVVQTLLQRVQAVGEFRSGRFQLVANHIVVVLTKEHVRRRSIGSVGELTIQVLRTAQNLMIRANLAQCLGLIDGLLQRAQQSPHIGKVQRRIDQLDSRHNGWAAARCRTRRRTG